MAPLRGQAGPCREATASWPAQPVVSSSAEPLEDREGSGKVLLGGC